MSDTVTVELTVLDIHSVIVEGIMENDESCAHFEFKEECDGLKTYTLIEMKSDWTEDLQNDLQSNGIPFDLWFDKLDSSCEVTIHYRVMPDGAEQEKIIPIESDGVSFEDLVKYQKEGLTLEEVIERHSEQLYVLPWSEQREVLKEAA